MVHGVTTLTVALRQSDWSKADDHDDWSAVYALSHHVHAMCPVAM